MWIGKKPRKKSEQLQLEKQALSKKPSGTLYSPKWNIKYSMVAKQMLITVQSIKQPGQSKLPGLNQMCCTQPGHCHGRRDGSQPGKPRGAQQEQPEA